MTFMFMAIVVLLAGTFFYQNYYMSSSDIEMGELTKDQLIRQIDLGLVKIHMELPENSKDRAQDIVLRTKQGACNLYQDILGRYYCRW